MYLKICPLQFWVPNVVAKGPYLVPISWKRTVATWVPMGTLFSCWVPIGSPFLFQGPHFLYLGLRDACKFNGDSISSQCLINCDNTNESHACLSVKSVLLQYIPPPPFKGFISMNYLVSLNFANICFLGPHSAAEGPHLVPISLKIGSPLGPHFVKLGSRWHVATVQQAIHMMHCSCSCPFCNYCPCRQKLQ